MATKTTTTLTDDIDGSAADVTVAYSWAGQAYEIDLSERNAEEFHEAIAPYLTASRPAGRASAGSGRRGRPAADRSVPAVAADLDAKAVRAWATDNGIAVSARGRIPRAVLEQYQAAHSTR